LIQLVEEDSTRKLNTYLPYSILASTIYMRVYTITYRAHTHTDKFQHAIRNYISIQCYFTYWIIHWQS